MSECDYWWTDDTTQWCGLTNVTCTCSGVAECCPICGGMLSEALRTDRETEAKENLIRVRRKRDTETIN